MKPTYDEKVEVTVMILTTMKNKMKNDEIVMMMMLKEWRWLNLLSTCGVRLRYRRGGRDRLSSGSSSDT
jgi:hypothetical protein